MGNYDTLSYLKDNKYKQSIIIAMQSSVIDGSILLVIFRNVGKKTEYE